ncbi:hypothetical protein Tco_0622757 [Tanacetum coccineum]
MHPSRADGNGEGSGGWWSLKVVAVVLAAAGVEVEGDSDVNGGVKGMTYDGGDVGCGGEGGGCDGEAAGGGGGAWRRVDMGIG